MLTPTGTSLPTRNSPIDEAKGQFRTFDTASHLLPTCASYTLTLSSGCYALLRVLIFRRRDKLLFRRAAILKSSLSRVIVDRQYQRLTDSESDRLTTVISAISTN